MAVGVLSALFASHSTASSASSSSGDVYCPPPELEMLPPHSPHRSAPRQGRARQLARLLRAFSPLARGGQADLGRAVEVLGVTAERGLTRTRVGLVDPPDASAIGDRPTPDVSPPRQLHHCIHQIHVFSLYSRRGHDTVYNACIQIAIPLYSACRSRGSRRRGNSVH